MSQTAATLNVRALGPIATAARVWRTPRALWVTVIAKATFAFRRDGVMQVVEPEPIAIEEMLPFPCVCGACPHPAPPLGETLSWAWRRRGRGSG